MVKKLLGAWDSCPILPFLTWLSEIAFHVCLVASLCIFEPFPFLKKIQNCFIVALWLQKGRVSSLPRFTVSSLFSTVLQSLQQPNAPLLHLFVVASISVSSTNELILNGITLTTRIPFCVDCIYPISPFLLFFLIVFFLCWYHKVCLPQKLKFQSISVHIIFGVISYLRNLGIFSWNLMLQFPLTKKRVCPLLSWQCYSLLQWKVGRLALPRFCMNTANNFLASDNARR